MEACDPYSQPRARIPYAANRAAVKFAYFGNSPSSSTMYLMEEAKLMDRQILRAKLYVPRSRPNAVPRPRLFERLDEGVRRELTVVSAPAGFGKTTLLADWSRRSELPVAWVPYILKRSSSPSSPR